VDENGKRKRIEITDEELFDKVVMDNPDTSEVDTVDDEEALSSVEFDLPDQPEETEDETTSLSSEGSLEESEQENQGSFSYYEAATEEAPKETTTATFELPEGIDGMAETEIEPETAATVLVEQEPATVADRPNVFPPTETPAQTDTASSAAAPVTTEPAKQAKNKKRLMIVAALGGLLIASAALTWWFMASGEETQPPVNQTTDTVTTPVEQPKLGIAVTVVEGTVEYMKGESDWQDLVATTSLGEGDSVRTGNESRLVLTLDDGSAIRLDANTTIRLTSLTANQIDVEHLDGIAYSRVVPSTTRTYTVSIDGTTYQAIGTAFATIKSSTQNGVWVFENSVRVNGSVDTVAEGKQFFQTADNVKLEGLVSDIDIDSLANDPFINWNLTLDEKDLTFKEKLGVLPLIKKRAAEKEKENENENKAGDNRRSGMSGNIMTLSVSDTSLLKWNYLGEATNGFKVVYSKESPLPVLGADSSLHFKNNTQTSARLSTSKMKGKYFVRVCAYTKENTCIDYSNVVIINI
jgi:ferric-dicitrate binding protein FerR (iron transport regulator)